MENKRFNYAIKNASIGALMQILTLFLSFFSRTIFVKMLGNDYLSCDGLFANVLTILSFSELGIGSAIVYSLYKPIANDDKEQIGRIMNLFFKAYTIVPIVIIVLGLLIMPFLGIFVDFSKLSSINESISLIYILFLINSAVSYVFGYSGLYLIANQRNYVTLIIQQGVNLFKVILQIIVLYFTNNYILYLIISILTTLSSNIVITRLTYKWYPWLKSVNKNSVTKAEQKNIFSNIQSIFRYQIGSVILNGTDNIIIANILDVSLIGFCSNYTLIINSLNAVLSKACNGLIATIGNYNLSVSKEDNYKMFNILFFLSFIVFSYCSIMLLFLVNPFISVWLGRDYLLNPLVVISLVLSFFTLLINTIPSSYRTTMGLFKETQNFPIIAAFINIFLSIVLAKLFGLSGIFFATSISRMLTYNVSDAYFVFKKGFGKCPIYYFQTLFIYFMIAFFGTVYIYIISLFIRIEGILGLFVKLIVYSISLLFYFLIIFYKTYIFKNTFRYIKGKLSNKN